MNDSSYLHLLLVLFLYWLNFPFSATCEMNFSKAFPIVQFHIN